MAGRLPCSLSNIPIPRGLLAFQSVDRSFSHRIISCSSTLHTSSTSEPSSAGGRPSSATTATVARPTSRRASRSTIAPDVAITAASGPGLREFLAGVSSTSSSSNSDSQMSSPAASWGDDSGVNTTAAEMGGCANAELKARGTFFIETYGCQMNVSDSEVVRAILLEAGFSEAPSLEQAGVVLANTCAIRERAEGKVWDRLKFFASVR